MEVHSCDTSAQKLLMAPYLQLSKARGLEVTHRICLQGLPAPPHIPEPLHTPFPLVPGLSRLPPAAGHASAGSGNTHFSGKFLADLAKICTTASTSPIFTPSLQAPCLISSSVEFLPLSSLKMKMYKFFKMKTYKIKL